MACELFNGPSLIWAFRIANLIITYYTAQNFTPRLRPPISPWDCWLLETSCLVWHIVTNCIRWMDVYGDNLVNQGSYMATGDCLSRQIQCDGIERVQCVYYKTSDPARDDSDRWRVHKHPVRSRKHIHVHCALRQTWTIPAGQCDTQPPRAATE